MAATETVAAIRLRAVRQCTERQPRAPPVLRNMPLRLPSSGVAPAMAPRREMAATENRGGHSAAGYAPAQGASAQRTGGLAEHAVELAAQQRGAGDDRDRDQRDQQAVLDRRGAALGAG